ncbi:MAG: ribonuclease HII [Candidatus Moranbacteria bacterium]|nr:ribonuclease HII [Candidatus Moranbacteria bacterium]
MKIPSCKNELALASKGKAAVGIDEAGRGPLAGPVVAGAAFAKPDTYEREFPEKRLIRDSKSLSLKQRKGIYDFMINDGRFFFGIAEVSPATIDRINILNASLLAMRLALENLFKEIEDSGVVFSNPYLLVDGNRIIPNIKHNQENFSSGDSDVFSIAAASIAAKVYRDNLMDEFDKQFKGYGFSRHRGYGTREHLLKLNELGPCKIHRRSFAPVRRLL